MGNIGRNRLRAESKDGRDVIRNAHRDDEWLMNNALQLKFESFRIHHPEIFDNARDER